MAEKKGKFTDSEKAFVIQQLAKDPNADVEKIAQVLGRSVRAVKGVIAVINAGAADVNQFSEDQQANIALFQEQLKLPKFLAEFVVVYVPYEVMPEHAIKLADAPVCQLTGVKFADVGTDPRAPVYLPEHDIVVSRLAAKMLGSYDIHQYINFCKLVAANAAIDRTHVS